MATDRSRSRKRKAKSKGGASRDAAASTGESRGAQRRKAAQTFLRHRHDPRSEVYFEPRATPGALASVLAMSVAAVAAGAGVYGRWFRGDELGVHPYATYLLAGGAAVMLLVALLGPRPSKPVKIGDAGLGFETSDSKDEDERLAWFEVQTVRFSGGMLSFSGNGLVVSLPLAAHYLAAKEALKQARERIPGIAPMELELPAAPAGPPGETRKLEPPQVAGMHCKTSGKLISVEKDARLCGRCGQVYHRLTVPKNCESCGAQLVS